MFACLMKVRVTVNILHYVGVYLFKHHCLQQCSHYYFLKKTPVYILLIYQLIFNDVFCKGWDLTPFVYKYFVKENA
jgi:hypothetical protein